MNPTECTPVESRLAPTGLTDAQAAKRLRSAGPNVLPTAGRKGLARIAWEALTQPMFLLLLTTAGVYAVLGALGDAAMLLVSVLLVGGLSIYQQQRTERAIDALKDLSSPRCAVVREGRTLRIASRDLVPGDRLIVNEGDRLAADAQVLESNAIQVDESLLTGESVPVAKSPGGGDANALLHAGSLVVQGDGVALVTSTGASTALGRIGGSLAQIKARPGRLQQELKRLVQSVALLAMFTCIFAASLFAWREGSWTAGLLVGLTLAMSLIPEEFAVVWTVMLALGAWRLAGSQVLTRQPQAIEALGTTTVLCVDKTGTLTRNQMALAALHDGTASLRLRTDADAPPQFHRLLAGAMQASVRDGVEPMDRAIFRSADQAGVPPVAGWEAGARRGVREGAPYVVQWWRESGGSQRQRVAVKGAAEALLARCDADADVLKELHAQAERWSASGLRVLAVAEGFTDARCDDAALPDGLRLAPLGLLGFMDPLRDEVPRAVEECRQAGVRVIMITGDAPRTADAIARLAGLVGGDDPPAVTGAELARMRDAELRECLRRVRVFARMDPAQKLRIVHALQDAGEVVAMTGDGVNDAPALRAADIGVAMGQRGTDVAREAAALVLLDDNFASLVEAVQAGRRIFVNLRKALGYLFAVHVPIVGVALVPVVMGGPALLLPLHVVLLELLIDPACSLVFEAEPEPADIMRVPPRASDARLFAPAAALRAFALGGAAFAGVALVQWVLHRRGASAEDLRLGSLSSIVLGNLLMLAWFRGWQRVGVRENVAFHALLVGVCAVALLLLGVPGVGPLFGLPTLHAGWLAGMALPGIWAGWHILRRKRPVAVAAH
ncbi:HAD-IC family P-type ATPase [Variovorax humicola]|uniref:HAD-IC family P-type ATPase n=1 Tax=Variovorax humicola TaxID=1769758 RepID=A0ABU8WAW2_9BURK